MQKSISATLSKLGKPHIVGKPWPQRKRFHIALSVFRKIWNLQSPSELSFGTEVVHPYILSCLYWYTVNMSMRMSKYMSMCMSMHMFTNISKLELEIAKLSHSKCADITIKIVATLFSGLALESPPALICIRVAPRRKHRQEHEERPRRKHRQEHEERPPVSWSFVRAAKGCECITCFMAR